MKMATSLPEPPKYSAHPCGRALLASLALVGTYLIGTQAVASVGQGIAGLFHPQLPGQPERFVDVLDGEAGGVIHQDDLVRWWWRNMDTGARPGHQEEAGIAAPGIGIQGYRITADLDGPVVHGLDHAGKIHHLGQVPA